MSKKETDNDNPIIKWSIIITILIICLWLATYFILKDDKDRGTLGDMFGITNALFSGLALGGIIFTILLQKKELGYQRDELRETRKEFVIQNKTLKTQRFENTFFNLLSIHNSIVSSIDFETRKRTQIQGSKTWNTVTITGRDVFEEKYEINKENFESIATISDLNNVYKPIYSDVQTDFGHYFRGLYRIVKFTANTEFLSKEELNIDDKSEKYEELIKHQVYNDSIRYEYMSMIRSQLSDYELLWVFYNCLSEHGNEKFKPLIERFSLLKNLPWDMIYNKELIKEYKDSAYKKTMANTV